MAHGNTRQARGLVWFAAFVDTILMIIMMCTMSNPAAGTGDGWMMVLGLTVSLSVIVYAFRQGLWFEISKERTWKAVCHGIGFSSIATRYRPGVGRLHRVDVTTYPSLRDVHGTHDNWTGIVRAFAGQTVAEYMKEADAFAQAYHVPYVTFSLADNGLIRIRAGKTPVPDAYDHPGHHLTPQQAADLLEHVPMARDINGNVWYMPIEGQHVLIAARTGGGKGSWIWSLVLGLRPAIREGLVMLYGCDPKRLELSIGRDWWHHYADTETSIVEMLERCVSEMLERAVELQGKVRKFTPSRETPLNIIVIAVSGDPDATCR